MLSTSMHDYSIVCNINSPHALSPLNSFLIEKEGERSEMTLRLLIHLTLKQGECIYTFAITQVPPYRLVL